LTYANGEKKRICGRGGALFPLINRSQEMDVAKKRFAVELPDEVLVALVGRKLLRRHVISQGKAAELLQISRWDLYDVMGRYQVLAVDITPEALR
jgi:hypothetical protein